MSGNRPPSEYEDRSIEDHGGNPQLVGVTGQGAAGTTPMPVYYDEEDSGFFGARLDESNDRLERLSDHEWDLEAPETVGDGIERIGEELGWDSLSEFAEEHLEDDEYG